MKTTFEMLQIAEEETFYRYIRNKTAENKEAHDKAKAALIAFAKENGII